MPARRRQLAAQGERDCWREVKTGIVFRVQDRAQSASGRPMVIEKTIVAHQGEWAGLAGHADRLHCAAVQEQGCPVGSGAMESTCAQLQGRFKRTGQFWTTQGKANLMSLALARHNGDWARVWEQ